VQGCVFGEKSIHSFQIYISFLFLGAHLGTLTCNQKKKKSDALLQLSRCPGRISWTNDFFLINTIKQQKIRL